MAHTDFSPIDAFTLLVDPDRVAQAVAHSERLARLRRRVCRPLDKPLIPTVHRTSVWDDDEDWDASACAAPDEAH